MKPAVCYPERDALRTLCSEVVGLVIDNATPRQWADWLRAPIEHAAANGNFELVTALLKAGGTGTPGLRGCRGRTLLDAAAEGGNEQVVSAILRAGATPDLCARSGSKRRSALHRAALHGHEAAARVLMMGGANVGSLDADKRGPLALAVRGGHEHLVCSLLLGGACPSAKDKKGDAPLHLAAWRGRAGIASALLLKGGDKNALDSLGRSPLIVAAEHGARGTTDALLMAGADPDIRYGENELSPLDSAASHGHISVLKALAHHEGVDVNAVDSTGYTALHMAADNSQSSAVGVLIAAGADLESQDIHQWTPLHCAARYNTCCDVVLELLRRGAKMDARESAGEYPLHIATQYLADEIVDLLLRWGADETKVDGGGHIPLEVAGTYAPDEAMSEEQREETEQRVRRLLVRAPQDRAWRRRGLVIMCRTRRLRTEKAQSMSTTGTLKQGPGHGEDTATSRSSAGRSDSHIGAIHPAKMPRTTPAEGGLNAMITVAASNRRLPGGGDVGDGGHVASTDATVAASSSAIEVPMDDDNDAGRVEFRPDFVGACARLVGLTEEGVFRVIVGFL
ncbi:unnamed protein product [Ectocarpus sp. 4 AP-2014]